MVFMQEIIFLLLLAVGNAAIVFWRKKQDDPDILFFCLGGSLILLLLYLGVIELETGSFFIVVPLLFLALFLGFYFKERRRLINGFLFNLFLITFGAYLLFNVMRTENILVGGLVAVIGITVLMGLLFGLYGLIIFLYWNAIIVRRKEAGSLSNLLTLILAVALTIYVLTFNYLINYLPYWLNAILGIIPLVLVYLLMVFLNFLTVSILYQFNHPKYNQDYIIVLGAGLINGETVSPLLARRIDKAIQFYQLQLKANGKHAKLLMSGGQGSDEKVPEAVAMRNYAVSQGIPLEDILTEERSTTTLENMRFSKAVIEENQNTPTQAIFSSNNYHIFRAGIFARWAGLNADGIGAPTALYYLPNAFLREYAAILLMGKKRHMLGIGLILLVYLLAVILQFFFS